MTEITDDWGQGSHLIWRKTFIEEWMIMYELKLINGMIYELNKKIDQNFMIG